MQNVMKQSNPVTYAYFIEASHEVYTALQSNITELCLKLVLIVYLLLYTKQSQLM